jgi:hypothetical protein
MQKIDDFSKLRQLKSLLKIGGREEEFSSFVVKAIYGESCTIVAKQQNPPWT